MVFSLTSFTMVSRHLAFRGVQASPNWARSGKPMESPAGVGWRNYINIAETGWGVAPSQPAMFRQNDALALGASQQKLGEPGRTRARYVTVHRRRDGGVAGAGCRRELLLEEELLRIRRNR